LGIACGKNQNGCDGREYFFHNNKFCPKDSFGELMKDLVKHIGSINSAQ
jgi:hypothetical protein